VPAHLALLRSGAKVGDDIYVSGNLGDARLALEVFRGHLSVPQAVFEQARLRMEMPTPRLALGQALRGIATSAADISDGLLGDLQHILKASGFGADIDTQQVARTLAANAHFNLPMATQLKLTLAGGDDYELVFTAPESKRADITGLGVSTKTAITRIGKINASQTLRLLDAKGHVMANEFQSFDHFKTD